MMEMTGIQPTSSSSSKNVDNNIPHSIETTSSPSPSNNPQSTKTKTRTKPKKIPKHLRVLPVLLLEFLALALTRAVLPPMLLRTFGSSIYFVMGCVEAIRGLLAFVCCPIFGRVSDVVGRKVCLGITVLGTCMPVCVLAILPVTEEDYYHHNGDVVGSRDNDDVGFFTGSGADRRIWIFVSLLAISGIFSSTFTLTFAYISDVVRVKRHRVSAYGLALATFGLSFTVGPMVGGYLSRVDDDDQEKMIAGGGHGRMELEGGRPPAVHPLGQRRVFTVSLILTILDLMYIYFALPESRKLPPPGMSYEQFHQHQQQDDDQDEDYDDINDDDTAYSLASRLALAKEYALQTPSTTNNTNNNNTTTSSNSFWNNYSAIKIFETDPLLREIAYLAFLYYTALWAVVSTLTLYATQRFHLNPERLGELVSTFGFATMISEAVLVRIIVPIYGEKRTIRMGLLSFALQCLLLGFSYERWHLFLCVAFSLLGNLVYPSLTSLVSNVVRPDNVGEALGAVNGVKSLTEGIGPLVFGTLMTLSERSSLPGWPYLLAGGLALVAYGRSRHLPDEENEEEDFVHELYSRKRGRRGDGVEMTSQQQKGEGSLKQTFMGWLDRYDDRNHDRGDLDEELEDLLGDDQEKDDLRGDSSPQAEQEDFTRLPLTFATTPPLSSSIEATQSESSKPSERDTSTPNTHE